MKSIKVILILILLGVLYSCESEKQGLGFFDKEYPPEAPWVDVTDFETAIVGAYWMISGPQGPQFSTLNMRLMLDGASDGLYNSINFATNADVTNIYLRQSEVYNSWSDNTFYGSYVCVGQANDIIDFLDKYPDHNPWPTDLQKKQMPRLEGEIHFCRAYAWWILSTIYPPMYVKGSANDDKVIPWRGSLPSGYPESVNSTLATTQQIYDRIVSDLKIAIKLIPEKYVAGRDHVSYQFGRANKYVAMALMARVYMQMNEFDLAKKYCDTIINYSESTGIYGLSKDPIDAYNTADATVVTGQETLWHYLYFDGDGIGSWKRYTAAQQFNRRKYNNIVNENRTLCCSDYFLETVGWQDPATKQPTAEALADKRYTQLYWRLRASTEMPAGYPTPADGVYEPTFYTTRAYVWGYKYYRNTTILPEKSNIPLVRLPEIYLTRAILRFNAGDVTGATSDINKVRARAGIPALATVTANDIHNERWKEMNFEGDRVTYLRSLHIDIPNGDRGTGSIPWNSDKWKWPVPQRERELNNAYKQ